MKLILSKKELKQLADVIGNCSRIPILTKLWEDIECYCTNEDGNNYVNMYSKNNKHNLINPISFDDSTMTLTLENDGLDFINNILSIAGFDELEDISNPSGLIFNIKVK